MRKNNSNRNKDFRNDGTISLYLTEIKRDKRGKRYVMTPFGYTRIGDDFELPSGKPCMTLYDFSIYSGKDEENKGEYYTYFFLWGVHDDEKNK